MRFFALLLSVVVTTTAFSVDKPNIIVIYTDDHGWPDIGAAGIYDDLKTPHIDALAASGVRATNGYSTAPQCVPSRAGLLSGRAQSRFGLESNADSLEGFDAQITIADRLKKVGYATGQIGKWHLGPTNQITDHGFDDVYSKNANRPCHANFTLDGKTISMQIVDDDLYHLDACSEAALAFIDRHADQPFFLYLAYRAPHVPLDAPKKYLDRFPGDMPQRRRQALAMLSSMDDGIGKITADLKKRGLTENTLIFYIGDNGAPLKIHKLDAPGGGPGWDGSLNEPMNGEKGMLAEGGIRVPFLVSWPGKIPPNQVYKHPVTALDVAATAVEISGQELDDKLDGKNLIPFLSGDQTGAPHEVLTWRWIAQAAIREGDWKLLVGGDRELLFNLESDPGEKRNRIAEEADVANRLREKLRSWSKELDPPGIRPGKMSETWERYFDFYFEGKAVPVQQKSKAQSAGEFQGWFSRNSTMKIQAGSMRVQPSAAAKAQAPFLVKNGLKMNGKFTAEIQLSTEKSGKVGIAWRTADQKDFGPDNVVVKEVQVIPDFQKIELEVPETGKTIHVRVLLPNGRVDIKQIEFDNEAGGKKWQFGAGNK